MFSFESAPRCGAKTKHNNGSPCRCPAVRGKSRCRIHGGAKGSGAPKYNHNALKNGLFTNEVQAFRKAIKQAINSSKKLIEELD
ncbi:HGGxSTG domain-containing protein [Legionella donaldsonii]|uniref:HGGxSTG domain-containing protein n=1 Tax=Legionella donaldsonii TaxID=45060 RepID=UPI00399CB937